jgi:hypothetical protein
MIRAPNPHSWPPVTVITEDDPVELAKMNAIMEQYDKNYSWYQAKAVEIIRQNRGKFICVAGQELFTADDFETAIAAARAKHPDDKGVYFRYVSPEKRYFIG